MKYMGNGRYYGVSKYNKTNKFRSRVQINGTCIIIGIFNDKLTAAKEYDKYIIANGLKNRLNFPEIKDIEIPNNASFVHLTRGKYAIVDKEDFENVNRLNWHAKQTKNGFYATRRYRENGKYVNLDMHHFILGNNQKIIDHIDGNGLNNMKSNLRFASHRQNLMNQRKQKNRTSIYKGVYFSKDCNKFIANIKTNRKTTYLGCFSNEYDAAIAYDIKAKELFGEFAKLNFEKINSEI